MKIEKFLTPNRQYVRTLIRSSLAFAGPVLGINRIRLRSCACYVFVATYLSLAPANHACLSSSWYPGILANGTL